MIEKGIYGYIATVRPANYKKKRIGLPMTITGMCSVHYVGMPETSFNVQLVSTIEKDMFEALDLMKINFGKTEDVHAVIDYLVVDKRIVPPSQTD